MKAAVALAVSISLLGCFPNNARHRTYAKLGEGAALIAGIAIAALANTGADCDTMHMMEQENEKCRTTAKWLGTAGVVLILTGLLGFVATVATAEDDAGSHVISVEKSPGSGSAAPTDGTGTGSAAPAPPSEPTPPPPAPGDEASSADPVPQ